MIFLSIALPGKWAHVLFLSYYLLRCSANSESEKEGWSDGKTASKTNTEAGEGRVRHQIILHLLTGHEVLELIAGIKEQRNSLRHDLMEAGQENLFQLQQWGIFKRPAEESETASGEISGHWEESERWEHWLGRLAHKSITWAVGFSQ